MGSQAQQAQSVPMASSTALLNASFPSLGRGLSSGFGSLARQSSIYSLTLDEFQSSIPEVKNFGSMNMDEFLKNIWTAEEQQAMAALMTTGSTGAEVQQPTPATEGLTRQPSLQRQGSLTLPRTLSRKTVDEVWRDIHASNDGANTATTAQQQRTTTFGEMTLEDFLVRAGVVRDDLDSVGNSLVPVSGGFPPPPAGGENVGDRVDLAAGFADREGTAGAERDMGAGIHPGLTLSPANAMEAMQVDAFKQQQQQVQVQWLSDQFRTAQQQQALLAQQQVEAAAYVNAAKRMGNGGPVGLGPLGGGLANSMAGGLGIGLGAGAGMSTLALAPASPTSPISDGMGNGGNGLSLSPIGGGYGLDGLRGRKRGPDGPVEKVVERRQRRMIKNRESAARSRARKQAYTVELEAEVTQLKEENMRLRKLQEEEMKKKQMIEAMVARGQQSAPQSRVMALRRTRSGPWCYQFSRGGGI